MIHCTRNIIVSGVAAQAVNYGLVMSRVGQVGIPVLVGDTNTGKSLLSKLPNALLGKNTGNAVDGQMSTEARLLETLESALFIVVNNREGVKLPKVIIGSVSVFNK